MEAEKLAADAKAKEERSVRAAAREKRAREEAVEKKKGERRQRGGGGGGGGQPRRRRRGSSISDDDARATSDALKSLIADGVAQLVAFGFAADAAEAALVRVEGRFEAALDALVGSS